MKFIKEYAVYNKKEEIVCIGTSIEVANYLGITLGSFYSRVTRNRNGKWNGKNKGLIIAFGDWDD